MANGVSTTIEWGNRMRREKWCAMGKVRAGLTSKHFLNLPMVLSVVLLCVGCIPQSARRVDANDNDIIVYTSLPSDIVGGYLAAFEAEHPEINVTLVNAVTLKLVERLLAEQEEPQADVVWGLAVTSMLTLEWNSLLKNI